MSPGCRGNGRSSLEQPGGGRLQPDTDASGALPSRHRSQIQSTRVLATILSIKTERCSSFLIRTTVGGFWRGVCSVGVRSQTGDDQSPVSVHLGAAGGGAPGAAWLLPALLRAASPLPQSPAADLPEQHAGPLLQVCRWEEARPSSAATKLTSMS